MRQCDYLCRNLLCLSDEILYHAEIHPEQYSNTLDDGQIRDLHSAINYVCSTSVDLLGDSDKFPEHWLFKHRWSKGKKNQSSVLPNGEKIEFVTVGGRTSAIVPSIQKKSGSAANGSADTESKGKRKRGAAQKPENDSEADEETVPKKSGAKKQTRTKAEEDDNTGRRRSTRARK